MKVVKLPIHKHPLLPITRFSRGRCGGCKYGDYVYGGYRCNELGCASVFHRECAELLEINHFSHPDHPLKLFLSEKEFWCYQCRHWCQNGYICSICGFKLDLRCAKKPAPLLILESSNLHEHPLNLSMERDSSMPIRECKRCDSKIFKDSYGCYQCEIDFHVGCIKFFPEANHTSHPQHPLKLLTIPAIPDYADEKCLLCKEKFGQGDDHQQLHHCDVCNFIICKKCMKYPPPVVVESPTTHEHQLQLVPRRINFTCNACGTVGDRSPYFCLQCNFMIHRECIDLPRVININRHDHRISYTHRLGHGAWKCKVCRKNIDGFYGAYTCVKCPSFAVHSLCATRKDVWDMIELEGMPNEEEEIAPFEVIDANTIKHFSHDHNLLRINKDGHGQIQSENIVCEACVLQILSETFYGCKQCKFVLHEKCANHPRKKRHVIKNLPFTLLTDSRHEIDECVICDQRFTGFRYKVGHFKSIDVRCAAISDTFEHGSHKHPLYFYNDFSDSKICSQCGKKVCLFYRCDECKDYILCGKCIHFPKTMMRNRYDDHPLFLSFGGMDVEDGKYWCEACETKVNPKKWFYTCYDCGTILHISCVVGDFSYIMPGSQSHTRNRTKEVVSNTSICRPLCSGLCNSRCKLPSVRKISNVTNEVYFCSSRCDYLIDY